LKTKEDILKNQPLTSLTEVNGYRQLFGNKQSSKYLLLCSTEEINSYRFGT